jgi:hypothetical protein
MRKKANLGIHVSFLNVVVIVVSLFSSCAGETNIIDGNNNKLLCFSVSVPSWKNNAGDNASKAETRAEPITETSFNTSSASNTFNLYADQYDGSSNYSTLIDNKPVSYSNNLWKTKTDYYWSGTSSKTINFYAYYPTTISNSITHTAGSAPTLTYTVPDDVANQSDIIVAKNTGVAGNTMTSTALSFNHIFAAVQFSVGSNGIGSGTISSISIGNVANSGTYTFGSGWSNVTGSKTFTISQSKTIAGTSGEDLYSGTYTLMMIPQTINNLTITVTYSNGGTLTKTISDTWLAGNTYNYKLSYIARTFDYTGNVQMYTVPVTGTYKLEVWGAQGGNGGGYGGYSYGNIYEEKGSVIYVCIGSAGSNNSARIGGAGGYNGGGHGGNAYPTYTTAGAGGGGGATHMSTTNRGILQTYVSYQSEIIIVAGGGGGLGWGPGGTGGGLSGGKSGGWNDGTGNTSSGNSYGGTQSGGYAFGLGQDGRSSVEVINADDVGNGGGGGGWYGGYSYQSTGRCSNDSGGGGSGYLGASLISGTTGTSNGGRIGNGYARITFVSAK